MGQLYVQYFQVWSSAASAHDDERAVKRLQTRQRFVNISEEKMAQKQQHCKHPRTINLVFDSKTNGMARRRSYACV